MNITNKKIEELKPYKNNPRNNDKAVDKVAESIKEFGFKVPMVIDKNNEIITGHTRLKAAIKLGLKEVPCIIADDLNEDQIKAFRLIDNKVSEFATWDESLLKSEMDDILNSSFDKNMTEFGFEPKIISSENEIKVKEDNSFDIDKNIPKDKDVKTKIGDIYKLGNHYLMCGDSTNEENVKKLMNNNLADMIFTDPPYGVDYKGINNDNRDGLKLLLDKVFNLYFKYSKPGSSFYCFHSDKCSDIFNEIYRKYCHFSSMIIWKKQSLVLSQTDYQSIHEPCLYGWLNNGTHNFYGDRKQTSVWEFDRKSIEGHTTPKPIGFISKAIQNSSQEKNIVIDLFGGSGSTLIACEQLNRKCYMMELDPKYCDVIIKRWETFTGKKAEKVEEDK